MNGASENRDLFFFFFLGSFLLPFAPFFVFFYPYQHPEPIVVSCFLLALSVSHAGGGARARIRESGIGFYHFLARKKQPFQFNRRTALIAALVPVDISLAFPLFSSFADPSPIFFILRPYGLGFFPSHRRLRSCASSFVQPRSTIVLARKL